MSGRDPIREATPSVVAVGEGADLLEPLIRSAPAALESAAPMFGVVIGELVAIAEEGRAPLVVYPGQPGSAALVARAIVDLHGVHIGRSIVLMFDGGNPSTPIVMGVVREGEGWPLDEQPGQVEVDVDGERMIVSASEQLVLRCGRASVTLTRAGKVLIEGTYVSSRSSGVNRVKGGSIQLN